MPNKTGWAYAHQVVMAKAQDGFRLSELSGVFKKCADRLIDQGRLQQSILPSGDRWVWK